VVSSRASQEKFSDWYCNVLSTTHTWSFVIHPPGFLSTSSFSSSFMVVRLLKLLFLTWILIYSLLLRRFDLVHGWIFVEFSVWHSVVGNIHRFPFKNHFVQVLYDDIGLIRSFFKIHFNSGSLPYFLDPELLGHRSIFSWVQRYFEISYKGCKINKSHQVHSFRKWSSLRHHRFLPLASWVPDLERYWHQSH